MIPCSMFPMGGSPERYPRDHVIIDSSNGETQKKTLYPSVYYVRGQGGGGGGGQCGYYGTGGGGGSGAGFEGEIFITQETPVEIITGIGGGNRASGTETAISNIMNLGGGGTGGTDNPTPGAGGIISVNSDVEVISVKIQSNGNAGNETNGASGTKGGANSVLTNSGGGIANGNATQRNASAPGAGGAGGKAWDSAGGTGGYGELKIIYKRAMP